MATLLPGLLHAKRKALGLTLQDVADQSGSSKSFIWELEHGVSEPSVTKAAAIAKVLKLSPRSIFAAATTAVTVPPMVAPPLTRCAAGRDGECINHQCPQLRDGEPRSTGRHCPLDT